MPAFSSLSLERLATCDPRLEALFMEVIRHRDCSIICGHRGEAEQNAAHENGFSRLKFPESKHNGLPSLAVDVAPYPVDWQNLDRFKVFGGFVLGVAAVMGLKIQWGGEWNSFKDYPHYELVG